MATISDIRDSAEFSPQLLFWVTQRLEEMKLEEEAAFARFTDDSGSQEALVVTEIGLVRFAYRGHSNPQAAELEIYAWPNVRGVEYTLRDPDVDAPSHRETELTIAEPELSLTGSRRKHDWLRELAFSIIRHTDRR